MTTAILLAAGESTRMGRTKALLPWAGTTLIASQVRQLREGGASPVIVVLGADAEAIRPHVPAGGTVVVNEGYAEGRASSLRAGANALPDDAGPIIILSVDQPTRHELMRQLLDEHEWADALITVPSFERHRGHPVVLSGSLLGELRSASESDRGLRGILERHAAGVREVEVTSEVVRLDVNTPEEYEAALARYGST